MADIETIKCLHEEYQEAATAYSLKYNLPLNSFENQCYVEISNQSKLSYDGQHMTNSFIKGKFASRIKGYQSERLMKKAFKINKNKTLKVLDGTGGLGHDSFILALLGVDVTYVEVNKGLCILFEEALRNLPNTEYFNSTKNRITIINADSKDLCDIDDEFDVLYLDPMFKSKKRLARNKEMTFMSRYLKDQMDIDEKYFLDTNISRKIIKREASYKSKFAADLEIKGKSIRFDVYLKGSI